MRARVFTFGTDRANGYFSAVYVYKYDDDDDDATDDRWERYANGVINACW